ncbi:hypothetical protein AA0114_g8658 [Alternaria tenuissima]|uniref:BTB domain-containing protein n=1 Tax=Alternaria tenuissima TaxID=119927 RepID=A0A4Q4MBI8_9PLEO|nr:hypothetical protein AA0114_g8658 [Alternaria tenuissima]
MVLGVSIFKSVTFVLAGRTTLSEHCPTEHIDVDYAIAERSPYLQIYLPQHVRDDRPLLPIQLGDVDPAGFKLYIEWLANGFVSCSNQRSMRLDSCIDLIYAHIVGSTFSQPHFQDYIIDTIASVLDPAQAFDQGILELLFLEKHASSVLRQFITDKMFGHDRRMLGMMRNSVEDIVTAHRKADEGKDIAGDVKAPGKKWSVDDDPELNAMAAQYSGGSNKSSIVTTEDMSHNPPKSTRTVNTKYRSFIDKRQDRNHTRTSQSKRPSLHITLSSKLHHQAHTVLPSSLLSPPLSLQALTADVDIDKPLPPTPSPHQSPLPLYSSFPEPMFRDMYNFGEGALQTPSTQDLVLECLGRLSPTLSRTLTQDLIEEDTARPASYDARPIDPPHNHTSPITSTESFIPAATQALPSPPTSDLSASPSFSLEEDIPSSLRPGFTLHTYMPTTNFTFASLPTPESTILSPRITSSQSEQLHNAVSSVPLPPNIETRATISRTTSSCTLIPPVQRPYHISATSPSLPHFRPLIKRKPAPSRGTDWLEQQYTLFALQGTQGFGLRKGNQKNVRRSRFMEILESVKEGGGTR